jgi:predicted enzyme related to lactoylglutathione lyase
MARGDFSHLEIPADDPGRVLPFYAAVFGWEFGQMAEFGDYNLFRMTCSNSGGAVGKRGVTAGERLSVAIEVDSVEEALETAVRLDGSVVRGKAEVMGFGWSAVIADPEGNPISIFEPLQRG